MKGTYCILASLPTDDEFVVGSLGRLAFERGIYVYVGSAQAGIESRVARHRKKGKKPHWHIDHLLRRAEVLSVVALAGVSKESECAAAKSLLTCEGARASHRGFGASDCSCSTHLIFFGDSEPEWVAEEISMHISMLSCAYPSISA